MGVEVVVEEVHRAVDVLLRVAEQVGDLLADQRADRGDEDDEAEEHADEDDGGRRAASPTRAARRLTPGSIASDRNSDTSNSRNSAERLLHTERVTIEAM